MNDPLGSMAFCAFGDPFTRQVLLVSQVTFASTVRGGRNYVASTITAAIAPAGAVLRRARMTLTAALDAAGSVARTRLAALVLLAAVLTLNGDTQRPLVTRIVRGSVRVVGTLTRYWFERPLRFARRVGFTGRGRNG
jgi:hypothetical protein